MKEKEARVEDGMHATRAAGQEGVVPGGGVALVRVAAKLDGSLLSDEERVGLEIVRSAIESPARRIASNAGHEGSVVVNKVREGSGAFGFNAATEAYGDLMREGLIDPRMVVRTALQNAASVAGLLLTTEAMVAEKPKGKGDGMPEMPAMDDGDY